MTRRPFVWKLKARELKLGERTLIMGVLNVTPDSFSDGGNYMDPDRAFARAVELEEQGADIIDVGAESTRPGSTRISAAEENRRLIPVLKRLRGKLTVPLSVDTYKAEVAALAIEHGAEIINDPSGLTFDPQLAKTVVEHDAALVLNHMRGRPETWAETAAAARHDGNDRARAGGHGEPCATRGSRPEPHRHRSGHRLWQAQRAEFGDSGEARRVARLELPVLVGPSRKSFLAKQTEEETRFATAAAVTASILAGAHVVRVHDVAEMRAVVEVADEVLRHKQQ